MKIRIIALILATAAFFVVSCSKEEPYREIQTQYKIVFVQNSGKKTEVYVDIGSHIKAEDIPEIEPVEGYDAEWSVKDFDSVSESRQVTVKLTPKKYSVTILAGDFGTVNGEESAVIEVTYGEVYDGKLVLIPKSANYDFESFLWGDKALDLNEKWLIAKDVVLTVKYSYYSNNY